MHLARGGVLQRAAPTRASCARSSTSSAAAVCQQRRVCCPVEVNSTWQAAGSRAARRGAVVVLVANKEDGEAAGSPESNGSPAGREGYYRDLFTLKPDRRVPHTSASQRQASGMPTWALCVAHSGSGRAAWSPFASHERPLTSRLSTTPVAASLGEITSRATSSLLGAWRSSLAASFWGSWRRTAFSEKRLLLREQCSSGAAISSWHERPLAGRKMAGQPRSRAPADRTHRRMPLVSHEAAVEA